MRIGLLTEGGYPYVSGDARLWCDRLVRGLGQHEFDVYALSRSERQESEGWLELPSQVSRVRTAPLWSAEDDGVTLGRRARRRFGECYEELAAVLCAGDAQGLASVSLPVPAGSGSASSESTVSESAVSESAGSESAVTESAASAALADSVMPGAAVPHAAMSQAAGFARLTDLSEPLPAGPSALPGAGSADVADRFANALYGLAELARDEGGLVGALRSERAVRALERACRAPGALRTAREARVPELLAVAAHLERALRPLSLDWYEDDALGSADLCHATAGGTAALPGLLARHFAGVPLLVTEYGVQLRTHYLASADEPPAVRALLAAFHGRLAAEIYRRAALITP
ncbi:DUF3492 domain-containing protein, partial [Streptomyces sp. MBT65]|uniref:DUF3492 domain-containing protein n=1 Tax=Streptomyces sp. MBT65 TaxID=1488395 RepID=UPI0027DA8377